MSIFNRWSRHVNDTAPDTTTEQSDAPTEVEARRAELLAELAELDATNPPANPDDSGGDSSSAVATPSAALPAEDADVVAQARAEGLGDVVEPFTPPDPADEPDHTDDVCVNCGVLIADHDELAPQGCIPRAE